MNPWEERTNVRKRARGIAIVGLLLILLLGCTWPWDDPAPTPAESPGAATPPPTSGPTPTEPPAAEMILPADRAGWVYVLPDGRRILFRSEDDTSLTLLDVATGEKVPISKEMTVAEWIDDELLYGESGDGQNHYVVNLQSLSVVKLDALPANSAAIPRYVQEAGGIYAIATGEVGHNLLLLERDRSGNVIGGYVVEEVRNLGMLLASVPYKMPPDHPYYDASEENVPSLDGQHYYTCSLSALGIYSQEGELLRSVSASDSDSGSDLGSDTELHCHGWAWDSGGVYFQEWRTAGEDSFTQNGPLELLEVEP